MTPRAARWAALLLGAGFLAWSQLPHVWAVRADARGYGEGRVYTGVLPTSAEDAFSYLAWMRQGAEGRFLLVDRYAVEPHPRVYVNVFYAPLGTIAGWTGVPIPAAYAAARAVCGAALLLVLWWFAGLAFDRPGPRLACFALAVVSGGWEGPYNWLVRNRGWEPISSPGWWTPEISTAFSTMTIPHFDAAFALQVLAVGLLTLAWRGAANARALAAAAGLPLLALVFFHPYEVVTCAALFAVYPLAAAAVERRPPWRDLALAAIPGVIVAPAIAWNAWIFSTVPAFRAMDEQAVMTTPEAPRLALALGAAGCIAVLALAGFRRMSVPQRVAAAWFVATLVAAHLPLRFQRRLLGGIQFPIAVLAVFALSTWIVPKLARALGGRRVPAGAAIAALLLPLEAATPYYVHEIDWREVRRYRHPVWIAASERDLLGAVDRAAVPGDGVFASPAFGMLVPGFAGARTYVGHYSLTIDSEEKGRDVARFFDAGTDDAWRRGLLERHGIDFVVWTSHERELGGYDPATAPWLSEIARFGEGETAAVLYRVVEPASTSPRP